MISTNDAPNSSARKPTLVILGRPNVGKSTLFNRLVGKRKALVHDEPGVTRDRIEETSTWWHHAQGYSVRIVDTGGMGGDRFREEIDAQVKAALSEADSCLFVLDAQTGITPLDRELVRRLEREGVFKKVPSLAVVNKVDAELHEAMAAEFYELPFEELVTVSAEHGRGIDDLKNKVLESWMDKITAQSEEPAVKQDEPPRLAIIGQPNVGKSTLVNAVLGKNRMVVSPIAGTTVDAIDSPASLGKTPVVLIDTAGIRRKNKTEQGIEVLSVVQAKKALERSNIALLLIDGAKGPTEQDEKIAGLIEEMGCSVILGINKWDTQERNREFSKEVAAERIRKQIPFLKYAPIVFLSGLRAQGLDSLGELIEEILHQRKLRVPTHEFTEWARNAAEVHNPFNARFYLCHQSGSNPPTFVCHVSDPDKVNFSLSRHLVNGIRDRWGYMGSPVRLILKQGQGRPAKSRAERMRPTKSKAGSKSRSKKGR